MTETNEPIDRRGRGVTPRALIIGVLLLPLNAYWITQMAVVRYEGHPTTVSLFFNAIFILFTLTLLNSLLARLSRKVALHRNELLVIYAMVTVASALCGHDLVQVVAPQPVTAYWLATEENKWEELFFQYLPSHLMVSDPEIYTPAFLGGATLYTRERIIAWLKPILSWSGFLAVLTTVMLAINALLRRRWMDREKLTYPITHMPLELTQPGIPLLRNKIMWIGFAIAAAINIVNGLHEFTPTIPVIKVRVVHYDQYMRSIFQGYPWGALAGSRISFYPFAIGLGLLLPLDLAFSCWFFYLFWRGQRLVSALVGLSRIPGFPYANEQAAAAYIGLAVFALWMARGHLMDIWQGLVGRKEFEDAGEPMGYRLALWTILIGGLFLVVFSAYMGMWAWVSVLVFIIYFGISLTVTRVRAELGPPAHDLHHGGPNLILTNIFGTDTSVFTPRQLTGLQLYYWFNRAYRAHPMPIQLESFKIAQMSGISQSGMATALSVATVVGVLAAFWAQVHNYYTYGIVAKMNAPHVAEIFGREPFQQLHAWLINPFSTRWPRIGAYTAGFLFTLLLMFLRVNFTWWPFHPVGYAISGSWSMNCLWLPILIAWAIKLVTMRYGGFKLFQRIIPGALGLVLGEFIIGSIWCLIGIILQIDTYAFWV